MDTAYIEQSNGQWEAWTYSDGQRVLLRYSRLVSLLTRWLRAKGFSVVIVK